METATGKLTEQQISIQRMYLAEAALQGFYILNRIKDYGKDDSESSCKCNSFYIQKERVKGKWAHYAHQFMAKMKHSIKEMPTAF